MEVTCVIGRKLIIIVGYDELFVIKVPSLIFKFMQNSLCFLTEGFMSVLSIKRLGKCCVFVFKKEGKFAAVRY